VAGTVEITPWILGWGETVEVLAPRDLRERIAEIGRAMASRHNGSAAATPANGHPAAAHRQRQAHGQARHRQPAKH